MNENGDTMGISFVIMPIEILQNKDLTANEKMLYCYLSVFKKGVCFQSNEKLAEMTGTDESTIKRGLKKLAELGYVFIEFVNNNSAMRRIYVVLDNPKKLAYLSRKGMFNLDKKASVYENTKSAEAQARNTVEPRTDEPTEPETATKYEPIVDISSMKIRPKRSDFDTDEAFEKAFYNWNKAVI